MENNESITNDWFTDKAHFQLDVISERVVLAFPEFHGGCCLAP